jgi:hypothetical protein
MGLPLRCVQTFVNRIAIWQGSRSTPLLISRWQREAFRWFRGFSAAMTAYPSVFWASGVINELNSLTG